jgi:hypothetical protein
MGCDSELPWNQRLVRVMRANREELKDILSSAGILPIDAEEFVADAILSVSAEKWSASTDLVGLLRQTLKKRVRSHGKLFTQRSPPGKQTKPVDPEMTRGKGGDDDWPVRFVLSRSKP